MRPTIHRPDLGTLRAILNGHADQETDNDTRKRVKLLRYIIVDVYEELVTTFVPRWTHADWAWCMRVVVEKCLRDIMRMGLITSIYDLVYSLFVGYVGAPVTKERLLRFAGGYHNPSTKFKDAYDITVAYFSMFDHDEKNVQEFLAEHDETTALEYLQMGYLEKTPMFQEQATDDIEVLETYFAIRTYLWRNARSAYFQLKRDGVEVYDFDVVFEQQTPPFLPNVFINLALIFFTACGWLPVGDNVGLFRYQNMWLENRTKGDPGLQDKLYALFRAQGNPRSDWETWWKKLNPLQRDVAHDRMTLIGPGLLDVASTPSPRPVDQFLVMFPRATTEVSPTVQHFVANQLQMGQVLHSEFLLSIRRYNKMRWDREQSSRLKKDTGTKWDGPKGYEKIYNTVPSGYFDNLVDKNFYLDDYIFEDKVYGIPSPATEGRLMGLPFQEHLETLQRTKEFFFFKSMFTDSRDKINTYYGMFLQACIEYSNIHDPEIWYNEDDDWVDWYVTDEEHPLVVKDRRLFVQPMPSEERTLVIEGDEYHVSERGTVCYAYDPEGKPIYATAYYCQKVLDNLLGKCAFAPLVGVCHKNSNYMVQLPRLEVTEYMGGETVLLWRGYELVDLDLTYWHKHLGHADKQKLKRYRKVIKGMPPYFWQSRAACEECW
ncbi:hypothetical protein B0I72DRAFT_142818 [Yarrowia lipolytica]|uniref:YALI0C22044p n=2 Tax=Yarrowia lipolytica TaxID=4952 RepID=Q6CB44_YARLI|nr:YALI0C22044p [Yarrowia lipolytica CLIB122]AOW03235.1 hypothetical protein YALI1_C30392g [Yarrowia lipolytica]KAB8281123.1 hypothetical protein BKA91DRAFT_140693 [Yarrowia lipolytica]KAE8172962.1 hypothetical protein BKA90DRAFT_136331 [Yarrowia lipolytica]KAJ8053729.1 hypothetical protein LXG23DRAFT_22308 [Yarrowia lipolytica]RDW27109.1 hypothetical protein B0I71DRAFT_129675 [Yarrowia lipolytica]|eukprot:XP_502118.1 YALI0C22044p [Yarrowia lipolytica CLIB122]